MTQKPPRLGISLIRINRNQQKSKGIKQESKNINDFFSIRIIYFKKIVIFKIIIKKVLKEINRNQQESKGIKRNQMESKRIKEIPSLEDLNQEKIFFFWGRSWTTMF
jgi:hypothetical protein